MASGSKSVAGREVQPTNKEPAISSFVSRALFWYAWPVLRSGFKSALDQAKDIFLPQLYTTESQLVLMERAWEAEVAAHGAKANLIRVILVRFAGLQTLFLASLFFLVRTLCNVSQIVFFYLILLFYQNGWPTGWGLAFVFSMWVSVVGFLLFEHAHRWQTQTLQIRVAAGLRGLVFAKALLLPSTTNLSAWQAATAGDVEAVKLFLEGLLPLVGGLLESLLLLGFLIYFVEWVLIFPLALLLAALVAVWFTGKALVKQSGLKAGIQGRRSKLLVEVLSSIRTVKFFGWEDNFLALIGAVRAEEMKVMHRITAVKTVNFLLVACMPAVLGTMLFVPYAYLVGTSAMTATEFALAHVFPASILISVLRATVWNLPVAASQVMDGTAAVRHLTNYLLLPTLKPNFFDSDKVEPSTVKADNATFAYASASSSPTSSSGPQQFVEAVKMLTCQVKPGELLTVVGPVGSGKTSLANGILGEIVLTQGSLDVKGRVAYVPQDYFIFNGTVRENILFGTPMAQERYDQALQACALGPDLEQLPKGDMTMIGDKGINLSGGQKARIAMARAVFADADIYLFDDPLSAVDPHVGRHLFRVCINGVLKAKTRILITNNVQYLSYSTTLCALKDGAVQHIGAPSVVLPLIGLADAQHKLEDDEDDVKAKAATAAARKSSRRKLAADSKLVSSMTIASAPSSLSLVPQPQQQQQQQQQQQLQLQQPSPQPQPQQQQQPKKKPLGLLRALISLVGGWPYFVLSILVNLVLFPSMFVNVLTLASYARHDPAWFSMSDDNNRYLFTGIYAGTAVVVVSAVLARGIINDVVVLRVVERLHTRLLSRMLHAPMGFFETTPAGMVLAWFTVKLNILDVGAALMSELVIGSLGAASLFILGSIISFPYVAIASIPVVLVIAGLTTLYRPANAQLRAMTVMTADPIYSFFNETLMGLTSIRAFQAQGAFLRKQFAKIDRNNAAAFTYFSVDQVVTLHSDLATSLVIVAAGLVSVLSRPAAAAAAAAAGSGGADLSPEAARSAVAIFFAMSTVAMMQALVTLQVTGSSLVSIYEELADKSHTLAQEAASKTSVTVAKNWPARGEVVIRDLTVRYRPDLPPVLSQLTLTVRPGEKIGIVGRTGAGKTSFTAALFRLMEASEGSITIDGVDIATLGVADLRRRLAITTQDVVMFAGSIRYNLDPFGEYKDDEIWQVLRTVSLDTYVSGRPQQLDEPITDRGANVSAGQKQQFALARVLLKKSKVLVLDEATSSVDNETDAIMQHALRTHLADATIFTIAHRLNTILDNDKVIVLQRGRIVEADAPHILLMNPDSEFSKMVDATGEEMAASLRKLAEKHFMDKRKHLNPEKMFLIDGAEDDV